MYRLYENSYKDYLTFFNYISKSISKNKHMPHLLDNKLCFKLHLSDKISTPNLVAHFEYHNKKITHYAEPSSDKLVLKPIIGLWGKGTKVVTTNGFTEALKSCSKSYIVEDFIKQHDFLNEIFNGSVNTIRIITIKMNEDIIVISAILRVGTISTKKTTNLNYFFAKNHLIYLSKNPLKKQ